jgi:ABC-type nitrate/sulfonate/bicarbonate transport system ATPase subunit
MGGAEPFIHLAGVAKTYGKGAKAHLAISNATFDVMPGELACLVGPSGCGKSTLLKILAGLHPHDAGTVRIGSPTTPFDPAKDIGMVFQQPLLLKWRTILANVLLPAEILGLPMAKSRARAKDLLALVGLAGAENKRPYELSGGMQQRAAIARALVHDPKLVLMDEPFGALDALTRAHLQDSVMAIHQKLGNTVLMITHDVDEAVLLSDRIVMMTNGPAAQIGEILDVPLARPRKRLELAGNTTYLRCRQRVLEFLYERHRFVEAA